MSGDEHLTTQSVSVFRAAATARTLLIMTERRTHRVVLPEQGTLVLGRTDEADVIIDDASVSRRHAVIETTPTQTLLRDCGSHNGTAINQVLVNDERRLLSGDVVQIGNISAVFRDPRPASGPRGFLPPAELLQRLHEEIDRCARYDRTLGLIAVDVRRHERGRSVIAGALASVLERSDVAGFTDDDIAVAVIPEANDHQLANSAFEVFGALRRVTSITHASTARFPVDGCDAATLLAAARAAARIDTTRQVVPSRSIERTIELGSRSVIVADPAMTRVYSVLERISTTTLPVLISGETGVGKENAAYAVHHWSGRPGPFVAINCAAIPDTLVESNLFGHRAGAFSGATSDQIGRLEAASGGTVFLDELGELPVATQAKLLRALDNKCITRLGETRERTIDLRVVAATNRDITAAIAGGQFRKDLYFRLNTCSVSLPPLRERKQEISMLARRFALAARAEQGRGPCTISDGTFRLLAEHDWPGNVRELKNAIEFAAAMADERIQPRHLPQQLLDDGAPSAAVGGPTEFRPLSEEIEELERSRMREALEVSGGVQTKAADLLGMSRRTFTVKVARYDLRRQRSGD